MREARIADRFAHCLTEKKEHIRLGLRICTALTVLSPSLVIDEYEVNVPVRDGRSSRNGRHVANLGHLS